MAPHLGLFSESIRMALSLVLWAIGLDPMVYLLPCRGPAAEKGLGWTRSLHAAELAHTGHGLAAPAHL